MQMGREAICVVVKHSFRMRVVYVHVNILEKHGVPQQTMTHERAAKSTSSHTGGDRWEVCVSSLTCVSSQPRLGRAEAGREEV